jgi:predicted anti-sigma-YlaC factor YlaD
VTGLPTCRELLEFLDEYRSGALDPMRRNAFDRHLAMCASCRNYLDSYQRTVEMERDAFSDPELMSPPGELLEAILAIRRPG